MTLLVFPGSLPNTYYSMKITSAIVVVLYNIDMDVIVIYLELILYHEDGREHYNQLTW